MGRLLRRFKASLSSDCPYHQANPAVTRTTASAIRCAAAKPPARAAPLAHQAPLQPDFLNASSSPPIPPSYLISYSHLPPDQLVFNQPSSSSRFEHKPPSNTFFTAGSAAKPRCMSKLFFTAALHSSYYVLFMHVLILDYFLSNSSIQLFFFTKKSQASHYHQHFFSAPSDGQLNPTST
ncbi:hypothetical protein PCASD_10277 [Puccinia coronata f. sp. avenae]|uniref:MSP domain-containing protein n=1 Tax=Puccinia coronata f. sp. avenae TaxID=200324 RepID=A0A2N5UIG0_9BASI|nr:hypothetical protein PCASD_10277 [Puccinia coronata f. sp. avenae]